MITKEDLDKIIEKIEQQCSKSDAYFDSEFYEDFGVAKGNKVGLLLYAKEFLKAVREIDNRKFDQTEMEIYNPDFKWINENDSNPFRYIEITNKLRKDINKEKQTGKESWKSKLLGFGCVVIFIFSFILVIIGLITFIKWIFY